jgi:dienelactone hydrolase
MQSTVRRTLTVSMLFLLSAACAEREPALDEQVVLENDGWRLIGGWRAPPGREPVPAVLLLHRAAGSRGEYDDLANALARRGVASLRLDLRGHGESGNLGRFEEPYGEHLSILEGTYKDVNLALRWLASNPRVGANWRAVVGASYSGEAIAEAIRRGGETVSAYVILSPGSFSDESVAQVDTSGVPWLFIRTSEEGEASRGFMDEVFDALANDSKTAEIRVIPGAGHATEILAAHPLVIEQIADWLAKVLDSER